MEIPDVLKNLTVDDEPKLALIVTLLHDEPSGIIVNEIDFLDDHLLKEALRAYHSKTAGAGGFTKSRLEKMTFDKKIKAIEEIPLAEAAAALRDQAVAMMQPMRRIRNKAAHVAKLTPIEAEDLYADPENRRLLANFPHNFKADCAAVQEKLQGRLAHPDFSGGS